MRRPRRNSSPTGSVPRGTTARSTTCARSATAWRTPFPNGRRAAGGFEIKLHTLSHLGRYLEEFERNATANGMVVHWASDAREMNRIVLDILRRHGGRTLIKSKSMLSEGAASRPSWPDRGSMPWRATWASGSCADAPSAQPYRAAGDPCAARGGGRTLRTGTRHGAGRQRSHLPDARGAQTFARQVPHGRRRHDGRQFRRGLGGGLRSLHQRGATPIWGRRFPICISRSWGWRRSSPTTVRWRSSPVCWRVRPRGNP